MKLVRHGPVGHERPGLMEPDGTIRDLSTAVRDIDGDALVPAALEALRGLEPSQLGVVAPGTRLGPCVGRVGKMICIGLNYEDHARETGAPIPKEPVIFFKATSAISGPYDPLVVPRGGEKVDWEVELGVVIGSHASYVDEAQALEHVAGYCLVHDVSERAFQLERSGQWVKGKSCDTFGPLGPYLVTRDEVPDPQDLRLWLEVDGERVQDGSTRSMIFGVAHVVSYLSQFMSLQPGDVISTGTPAGVGLSMTPPRYLRPGQTVRLGADGLGEQQQLVVSLPPTSEPDAEPA
jgi:2-keto-4-pentenoate hydratase/2-oxohepta-3-ene-1,7-dioic acid hydratase in catechol pathway